MDSSRQVVERLIVSGMVKAWWDRNLAVKITAKVELTEGFSENEDQQNMRCAGDTILC